MTTVVVVGVGGVGVKGTTVAAAQWVVPLASASSRSDRLARVCGGTMDMVNVGFHAPTCPLLILCCARGDHYHKNNKRPRSRRVMKFLLFREITFLTRITSEL
jgi:phage terminase large subunit-like protein